MLWLIVEATELNDQYECDCDRTPVRLVETYEEALNYLYKGYEVWYAKGINCNFAMIESDEDFFEVLDKNHLYEHYEKGGN